MCTLYNFFIQRKKKFYRNELLSIYMHIYIENVT